MARWQLWDPFTDTTYTFSVNPSEITMGVRSRSVVDATATSPNGRKFIFEGRPKPPKFTFQGVLLDQPMDTALRAWYKVRRRVRLTDDQGTQTWIYITGISFTRERVAIHRWRHRYTITGSVTV